jgi:asparagine synthase (glutamine-hydrolysing)
MGYNYFQQVSNGKLANSESNRLLRNLHMFDVLRADRCFSAHGLEIRIPFLDKNLVDYTLKLKGDYKMFQNGMEKSLLRDAVRKEIPEFTMSRVIDRQKERFSDGCGFSYVPDILNFIYNQSKSQIKHSGNGNTSVSLGEKEKEEREFHKKRFQKEFGDLWHLIVKRELPNWCDTSAKNQKLID